MKKFILIALVLVIATAFAFAAFQAPDCRWSCQLQRPTNGVSSGSNRPDAHSKRRLEFLTWRS